jgi:hypothetical protein
MASLYLLKNPDHYTNYKFKPFWWKSYVGSVRKAWDADERPAYPDQGQSGAADGEAETQLDQMVLMKSKDGFVGTTNIDDYVWRPAVFEHTSFYDYIQMTTRVKRTPKQLTEFLASVDEHTEPVSRESAAERHDNWLDDDLDGGPCDDLLDSAAGDVSPHAFLKDHPLWETHYVRCERSHLQTMVPNFTGGALPRMDQGDRDYYCCTMLTLFKPWRDTLQLKPKSATWHDTFTKHVFSDKASRLMKHFNIRYECNDARDDYSALDKQKRRAMPLFADQNAKGEEYDGETGEWGEFFEEDLDETTIKGPNQLAKERLMAQAERVLHTSGWTAQIQSAPPAVFRRMVPEIVLSGSQWKARISRNLFRKI